MYEYIKIGKAVKHKGLYWRENRHGYGYFDELCSETCISDSDYIKTPTDFVPASNDDAVTRIREGKLVNVELKTTVREL